MVIKKAIGMPLYIIYICYIDGPRALQDRQIQTTVSDSNVYASYSLSPDIHNA